MSSDAPVLASEYELLVNSFVQVSRLNQSRSLGEVVEALAELLRHLIGGEAFVVAVRNPSLAALEPVLVMGSSTAHEDIPRFLELQQNFYGSPLAVVPLRGRDGKLLGLVLISALVPHKAALDARDYSLLDVMREHGSIALESALLLATLQARGRAFASMRSLLGSVSPPEALEPILGSLVVRAGEDGLAVTLDCVREIFQMVALRSRPPDSASSCMGLIDHRGDLIPVFDLHASLMHSAARTAEEMVDGFVVVLQDGDERFGCVVDQVTGLYEPDEQQLVALPERGRSPLTDSAVVLRDGSVVPLFRHGRSMLEGDREAWLQAKQSARAAAPRGA